MMSKVDGLVQLLVCVALHEFVWVQEWTGEEDRSVTEQLRELRGGLDTGKNMTVREAEQIQALLKHRTVNAIKFRWNDKLKKLLEAQAAQEGGGGRSPHHSYSEVDPDAFFTAHAPTSSSSTGLPVSALLNSGGMDLSLITTGLSGGQSLLSFGDELRLGSAPTSQNAPQSSGSMGLAHHMHMHMVSPAGNEEACRDLLMGASSVVTPSGPEDTIQMDADLALALSLTPSQQNQACGLRGGSVESTGDDKMLSLSNSSFERDLDGEPEGGGRGSGADSWNGRTDCG